MRSKDAHGMTNTVNPDQEQSDFGFTMFTQIYLSEGS